MNPTLIDQLEELQAKENSGRGICCVRSIITWLRKEDLDSAKACTQNEWDKIRSYPLVARKLYEIFPEVREDHVRISKKFGFKNEEWI